MKKISLLALLLVGLVGCSDNPFSMNGDFDKAGPIGPPVCEDRDSPFSPPSPAVGVGDFSLINVSGDYHLYLTNGLDWQGYQNSQRQGRDFAHFMTSDFENWSHVNVTGAPPGVKKNIELRYFGSPDTLDNGWSSEHIWAPHVFFYNSEYYMFYAGVDYTDSGMNDNAPIGTPIAETNVQAIGLAKSTNLSDWEYHDSATTNTGFLFDATGVSWVEYGSSGGWLNECRDPFVFKRPSYSQFEMLVSVKIEPDDNFAIAYLTAPALEGPWTWQYPIEVTFQGPGWGAESSCIVLKDGQLFLFWTEVDYGGSSDTTLHAAVATIMGPQAFNEISVDGADGFACELTVSDTGDVIFSQIVGSEFQFGIFDYENYCIDVLTTCGF